MEKREKKRAASPLAAGASVILGARQSPRSGFILSFEEREEKEEKTSFGVTQKGKKRSASPLLRLVKKGKKEGPAIIRKSMTLIVEEKKEGGGEPAASFRRGEEKRKKGRLTSSPMTACHPQRRGKNVSTPTPPASAEGKRSSAKTLNICRSPREGGGRRRKKGIARTPSLLLRLGFEGEKEKRGKGDLLQLPHLVRKGPCPRDRGEVDGEKKAASSV